MILDMHLSELYDVETRALKQAVKRNISRFPDDFMFQLTEHEMEIVVSQNVIPSKRHFGGAQPFAFTESGIAMLSSVLKSEKAIQMNIAIIRTFIMIRRMAGNHRDLKAKLMALDSKYENRFKEIHKALRYLLKLPEQEKSPIGFKQKGKEN